MLVPWLVTLRSGHDVVGKYIIHSENRISAKTKLEKDVKFKAYSDSLGVRVTELIITRPAKVTAEKMEEGPLS